jgi:hypothetical protein
VFVVKVKGADVCSGQYEKLWMDFCSTTDLPSFPVRDRSRLSMLTEDDVSVWLKNVLARL